MAPVALAVAVLELNGSATDLGLVLSLAILPQVFFLLVGGVVADRLPRHHVMVASNLVAAIAQAIAAYLLISGRARPVIAKESLGGARVWGIVLAATGIGLVLGSLIALRIRPERPLFFGVVATILIFPPLVLLALEVPWPVLAASTLLMGVGVELFSIFWDTSLQTHVPNDVLSRVSAWDAIGSLVLIPAAYAVVGPLSAAIGIDATLWLCSGIVFVAIAAQLLSREVRELRRTPTTA